MDRGLLDILTLVTFVFGSTYGSEEYCPVSNPTSFMVKELPIADILLNPCASSLKMKFNKYSEDRLLVVLKALEAYCAVYEAHAESIANVSMHGNCQSLVFSTVAPIPDMNNTISNEVHHLEILEQFYVSFMNHTVEAYFMVEENELHDSSGKCESKAISRELKVLAQNVRNLFCIQHIYFQSLKHFNQDSIHASTLQVLNRRLTDQPKCSERLKSNCRIIHSVVSLLNTLSVYLSVILPQFYHL